MHLEEFAVVEGMPDMGQPARKEYLDALVGIADAGMDHAEVVPVLRDVAGLFLQFAPGGEQGVLAGMDLAGRQFEEDAVEGVAELALEEQLAVGQLGDHDHRAGMRD